MKEINEVKNNKRKAPKKIDAEDDIAKKKIKKDTETKNEKINISSKIFEDIGFFEQIKNKAEKRENLDISEPKQESNFKKSSVIPSIHKKIFVLRYLY